MSFNQSKLAWDAECESYAVKLVLVALAEHADQIGVCWPSISLLARKCSMTRQGVLNQISKIERNGWLKTEREGGKSNRYLLSIPVHPVDLSLVNKVDQSTTLTSPPGRLLPVHPVDYRQSTPLTGPVHPVDPNHQEPSVEPPLEPPRTTTATDSDSFRAAWNGLPKPFRKIRAMSAGRTTSLRARMREPFWRENWQEALALIPESDFCRGLNEQGWIADPEFFLRPDSVTKILEGKYGTRNRNGEPDLPDRTDELGPDHTEELYAQAARDMGLVRS